MFTLSFRCGGMAPACVVPAHTSERGRTTIVRGADARRARTVASRPPCTRRRPRDVLSRLPRRDRARTPRHGHHNATVNRSQIRRLAISFPFLSSSIFLTHRQSLQFGAKSSFQDFGLSLSLAFRRFRSVIWELWNFDTGVDDFGDFGDSRSLHSQTDKLRFFFS